MELLPDDEYYAQLNTVNLAAGAMIRNHLNEVLVVNPVYREHWLIPGGCVDKDESPAEACRREVKEEIGLDLPVEGLLSIEYLARRDYKPEAIHFIFDCGRLDATIVSNIRLCDRELSEFQFVSIEEACRILDPGLSIRYRAAWEKIEDRETAYLDRGETLF